MGLTELLPMLKVVAEVGVMVLMSVIVGGGFVWMIRFAMPKMAEAERLQRDAIETRHRAERNEQRTDFLAALSRMQAEDKEAIRQLQAAYLTAVSNLEQRVIDRHAELVRRTGDME